MKSQLYLMLLLSILFNSCKPEKAYWFTMGKYVGKVLCNNDSLNVFQYVPNHPEVAGFVASDTLSIEGVKYDNVFLMYTNDLFVKDSFDEFKKDYFYQVTGKKEFIRTDFPCIKGKGLRIYENVLKVWFPGPY